MMDRRLFLSTTFATSVVISAPAPAAVQTTDFDVAVAHFHRCWDRMLNDPYVDVLPAHPDYRRLRDYSISLGTATNKAFQRVMSTPPPDAGALATKLEIMAQFYTDFEIPEEHLIVVAGEARRLAA